VNKIIEGLPVKGRLRVLFIKCLMEIVLTISQNPQNCGRGFGKRITLEKVKSQHRQFMDFF